MKYVMCVCERCKKEFREDDKNTLREIYMAVHGNDEGYYGEFCTECTNDLLSALHPVKSGSATETLTDEESEALAEADAAEDCAEETPELLDGDNLPNQLAKKESNADSKYGNLRAKVSDYFANTAQPIKFRDFVLECRRDLKITTDTLSKAAMLSSNNVYTAVSTGRCFPFIKRAIRQYYGVEVE